MKKRQCSIGGELLDRLKNVRTFRGGAKSGLAYYHKSWKEKMI